MSLRTEGLEYRGLYKMSFSSGSLHPVLDELLQHGDAVSEPDPLWVYREAKDVAIHVGMHPIELTLPDLQYLAGC